MTEPAKGERSDLAKEFQRAMAMCLDITLDGDEILGVEDASCVIADLVIARIRAEQAENDELVFLLNEGGTFEEQLSKAVIQAREQAIHECADKAYEYLSEDTNLARLTKGLILALLHKEEEQ